MASLQFTTVEQNRNWAVTELETVEAVAEVKAVNGSCTLTTRRPLTRSEVEMVATFMSGVNAA
jgi:hypothetical protein